jgi:hypothetical protein
MTYNKVPKSSNEFSCEKCDYNTSRLSQYDRHLLTAKHQILTDTYNLPKKKNSAFTCECGKEYKHRQSLNNHKQKCTYVYDMNNDIPDDPPTINDPTSDASTILLLLKQNQDFKQMMLDQTKQLVDAVKNNTGSVTNNNNNTTNNNNQQFNLNFFLNDTCKDAMNITDFLGNLDVHIDEIEYIGNHGYVNGMTKMIMERLKEMDVTKRPIHCTDIKRETMYIKDKNEWSKDTDELTKVRKILNRISMNNYRTIPEWKNAHPECEVVASRTYDFCYSMMESLLGDVEDEQIKLDNKIIKTMAKVLYCKN